MVARPTGEAAGAIPGVDDVRTLLIGGPTLSLSEAALERVFEEIRVEVDVLAACLPYGTRGPIVDPGIGDVSAATVAMTGEGFDPPRMRALPRLRATGSTPRKRSRP